MIEIDWIDREHRLIQHTRRLLSQLIEVEGDDSCSFGYLFGLFNYDVDFELCANTKRDFENRCEYYRNLNSPATIEDIRWNSAEIFTQKGKDFFINYTVTVTL